MLLELNESKWDLKCNICSVMGMTFWPLYVHKLCRYVLIDKTLTFWYDKHAFILNKYVNWIIVQCTTNTMIPHFMHKTYYNNGLQRHNEQVIQSGRTMFITVKIQTSIVLFLSLLHFWFQSNQKTNNGESRHFGKEVAASHRWFCPPLGPERGLRP